MNISNLDTFETQKKLQEKVKSSSFVTFQGVEIFKMNFLDLFSILEVDIAKRVFLPKDQDEFILLTNQILVDGLPMEIIYSENPLRPSYVICPICNGTGYINSNSCTNCGGQYNNTTPKGVVLKNSTDNPCTHNYLTENLRNTYTLFQCIHCMDSYYKTL